MVKYVVYEFYEDERVDLDDAQTIISITPYTSVLLPDEEDMTRTFVVTSVDRQNRESAPVTVTVP